jgi:hypothetical protein
MLVSSRMMLSKVGLKIAPYMLQFRGLFGTFTLLKQTVLLPVVFLVLFYDLYEYLLVVVVLE